MGTYRTITEISQSTRAAMATAVLVAVAASASFASSSPRNLVLPNGLSATIVPSDYLAERIKTTSDGSSIQLDDGRLVPVTTDINDPSIYNQGDGTFHPFTDQQVEDALRAVLHPWMRLSVRVYLLPYPRRNLLVSSTSGNEIFLSPQVLEIDPAVGEYIVAHELGHAFHNRFMPDGSAAWTEYRQLRNIADATRFSDASAHAYRPKEIFAEDFRVLFGGTLAAFDGRQENTELVNPNSVGGLEEFYERVARPHGIDKRAVMATSYPNPFNPETEIRIAMPAEFVERGAPVSIRVYAVTGALVRNLHAGSASGDFVVRWDGRDESGNRVASNTYYAAIQVGDKRETLKLVLLK
jgi:hypothetical protein